MLTELREMRETLQRNWETLHAELDEMLGLGDQLEDEHDDHIADLNSQLCEIAEWIDALDATIRKKEASLE